MYIQDFWEEKKNKYKKATLNNPNSSKVFQGISGPLKHPSQLFTISSRFIHFIYINAKLFSQDTMKAGISGWITFSFVKLYAYIRINIYRHEHQDGYWNPDEVSWVHAPAVPLSRQPSSHWIGVSISSLLCSSRYFILHNNCLHQSFTFHIISFLFCIA